MDKGDPQDTVAYRRRERRARTVLLAILMVMGGLIAAISWTTRTGQPSVLDTSTPVTDSRELRFERTLDDTLLIFDATSEELLRRVAPGEESFIRGTLRVIARERHVQDVDGDAPVLLQAHEDGAVLLRDMASGVNYDLRAFGRANLEAFAALLRTDALAVGADNEPGTPFAVPVADSH